MPDRPGDAPRLLAGAPRSEFTAASRCSCDRQGVLLAQPVASVGTNPPRSFSKPVRMDAQCAPETLIDLLGRLQLATLDEMLAVGSRVRRLAGELPDFESVWVDALAQARVLSPFQAAQINAGRGEALLCGAYVLLDRLASPHYCECFAARHIDDGRVVRLYRVRQLQVPAAIAARQLAGLAEQLAPLRGPMAAVIDDSGIAADGVWSTCPEVPGTTASAWVSQNGRFAPPAVLSIARTMIENLANLELLGAVHGDIGAAGLIIHSSGRVFLPMPGLRGIVRPSEGYSFNDLPGEAYDYLRPNVFRKAFRQVSPAICSPAVACGGIYSPGVRRWPAGTAWESLRARTQRK